MSINRQRGLTMIELIIFILIVSVAVVGVLQVIFLSTRNSADPVRRKQAMAIAEGLVEEVRLAAFTYCDINDPAVETALGPGDCTIADNVGQEGNNARPFDNVNDYVNQYGVPVVYGTDVMGNNFPAGYTATVAVSQDAGLGPSGAQLPQAASLRITVSVAYGSESVVLESYRTRFAPSAVPISQAAP